MYPDIITPRSFPDLLQRLDYDPLQVLPGPLPPHPRVLTTGTQLARARDHAAQTAWGQAVLQLLLTNARDTGDLSTMQENLSPCWETVQQLAWLASRNALAFQFTGDEEFHYRALALFRLLARHYPRWPVDHGSRVAREDLGEHRLAILFAETYDLLAMTSLTAEDANLFRQLLAAALPVLDDCPHRTCGNHHTSAIRARLSLGAALGDYGQLHDALYGCQRHGRWHYGLIHALRHDILSDGTHWEGAPGYHFYTLLLITEALSVLERLGIDLWQRELPAQMQDDGEDLHRAVGPRGLKTIKAAFDAPFYQIFPNGDFSLLHDSRLANIRGAWIWGTLYNRAWEVFGDPKYAWLLHRMEHDYPPASRRYPDLPMPLNTGRGDVEFVNLRDAEYPAGAFSLQRDARISLCGRHERGCSLFPVLGRALLRSAGSDTGVGAFLAWGPHWAGHMGPASLHLDIAAGGQRVTDAPRSGGYEDAHHLTWNRTTIAHNTVTVDEASMFPYDFETNSIWEADRWRDSISDGTLELFQPGESFSAVRAANENVYPGVRLDRTLVVADGMLLDLFRVTGDRDHRYDWAMHGLGHIPIPAGAVPCDAGQARGYGHLAAPRTLPLTGRALELAWGDAALPVRLCLFAPSGSNVILAGDPAINPDSETLGEIGKPGPRTAIIARVTARTALFAALWSFGPDRLSLDNLDGAADTDLCLVTRGTTGAHRWYVPVDRNPVTREHV